MACFVIKSMISVIIETYIIQLMASKGNEEIAAMNLRVLQRDGALRNTEKILRTIKFVIMARYDEECRHWNYLKVRGPMFLLLDRFGQYRLAIMNHCEVENRVIPLHADMKLQLKKIENGDGYILNYMIEDNIKRSIFGIWSADQSMADLYKDLTTLKL